MPKISKLPLQNSPQASKSIGSIDLLKIIEEYSVLQPGNVAVTDLPDLLQVPLYSFRLAAINKY